MKGNIGVIPILVMILLGSLSIGITSNISNLNDVQDNITRGSYLPPQNVNASSGDGFVSLTWDLPSLDYETAMSLSAFRIYRGTHPGGEKKIAEVDDSTTTSYWDKDVKNGVTYYYYVTAVYLSTSNGDFIESGKSNEVSATPLGAPTPPTNLQLHVGKGYILLTWNKPSNDGGREITKYKIYRGTEQGGEKYLAEVDGNITRYNDTSVVTGITYYYYVIAVNSIGESKGSNEVSMAKESSSESNTSQVVKERLYLLFEIGFVIGIAIVIIIVLLDYISRRRKR